MYAKLTLLAVLAIARGHDVILGSNGEGNKIFDEDKVASPAIWRQIQNVTVQVNGSDVISGIIITDKRPDKGGDAKVIDGGIGQKNVTIELKSPTVLRGYDFHIEVYAVPDENQNENTNSGSKSIATSEQPPLSGVDVPLPPIFADKSEGVSVREVRKALNIDQTNVTAASDENSTLNPHKTVETVSTTTYSTTEKENINTPDAINIPFNARFDAENKAQKKTHDGLISTTNNKQEHYVPLLAVTSPAPSNNRQANTSETQIGDKISEDIKGDIQNAAKSLDNPLLMPTVASKNDENSGAQHYRDARETEKDDSQTVLTTYDVLQKDLNEGNTSTVTVDDVSQTVTQSASFSTSRDYFNETQSTSNPLSTASMTLKSGHKNIMDSEQSKEESEFDEVFEHALLL